MVDGRQITRMNKGDVGRTAVRRPMNVGVPKELKIGEFRVALTPGGTEVLRSQGHRVLVQKGLANMPDSRTPITAKLEPRLSTPKGRGAPNSLSK